MPISRKRQNKHKKIDTLKKLNKDHMRCREESTENEKISLLSKLKEKEFDNTAINFFFCKCNEENYKSKSVMVEIALPDITKMYYKVDDMTHLNDLRDFSNETNRLLNEQKVSIKNIHEYIIQLFFLNRNIYIQLVDKQGQGQDMDAYNCNKGLVLKKEFIIEPEPNNNPETVLAPEVESDVVSAPEAEPEVVSAPEVESEPEVVSAPEVESEPEVVSAPEVESEVVSAPEVESESEVVPAPEVESDTESESEVVPAPEVESDTESESEVVPAPEVESDTEVESESEVVPAPEVESESDTEAESEVVSAPEAELETESREDDYMFHEVEGEMPVSLNKEREIDNELSEDKIQDKSTLSLPENTDLHIENVEDDFGDAEPEDLEEDTNIEPINMEPIDIEAFAIIDKLKNDVTFAISLIDNAAKNINKAASRRQINVINTTINKEINGILTKTKLNEFASNTYIQDLLSDAHEDVTAEEIAFIMEKIICNIGRVNLNLSNKVLKDFKIVLDNFNEDPELLELAVENYVGRTTNLSKDDLRRPENFSDCIPSGGIGGSMKKKKQSKNKTKREKK